MTETPASTLPLDDDRMPMTLGERVAWVYGVVVPLAAITYFALVIPQLASTPASRIAWQVPMLVAIAVVIIATIAVTIVSAIVAAVMTRDLEPASDIRDAQISRRSERSTFGVIGVGFAGVLALAMLDIDQFYIGSAVFAVGVVGAVWGSITRIRSYRARFDE